MAMDSKDVKKFVNQIFHKKGFPTVKNFAAEFSDGCKSFCTLILIID